MVVLGGGGERLSLLLDRGGVVKICGLRQPQHAAAAAAAGADLISFIFAPARRRVSPGTARACIAAAREAAAGRTVLAVGVFVDASPTDISGVIQETGIEVVQLHGDESPEMVQSLPAPALKVLRPPPGTDAAFLVDAMGAYRLASVPPAGYLIEGYSATASGGTGARADWGLAAEVNAVCPIILGGGLGPKNVGTAIRTVRPVGVDVSSGVEIDGRKDSERIVAFIRAAREAFAG